jgi:Dynamin GTPase effector domain
MSNTDHVIQDIHDILKSYYKVARKRFVDNICMHAANYHLITGPDTPLKLFSPEFIVSMTPEQIEDIAGEDATLKRKRVALKKEIQELEEGRRILN